MYSYRRIPLYTLFTQKVRKIFMNSFTPWHGKGSGFIFLVHIINVAANYQLILYFYLNYEP